MKEILYNLEKIQELSDNDAGFIKAMVEIFITEMPRDLERLALALVEDDRTRVHEYAHKMKPSVDMLSLIHI